MNADENMLVCLAHKNKKDKNIWRDTITTAKLTFRIG